MAQVLCSYTPNPCAASPDAATSEEAPASNANANRRMMFSEIENWVIVKPAAIR
jgi:hypothetical protein